MPKNLAGKRLALVAWSKNRNGEDDVWVHAGTVKAVDSEFLLDRGGDKQMVRLLPEWLSRIKPVSEDLKEALLGAEFCISLTVGPIPEGVDPSQLEPTGLQEPPE